MNDNHPISFPEGEALGGHDPQVVDVLKRCLVRDPKDRATIKELKEHPYLKPINVMACLTPNTKMLVKAQLRKKNVHSKFLQIPSNT